MDAEQESVCRESRGNSMAKSKTFLTRNDLASDVRQEARDPLNQQLADTFEVSRNPECSAMDQDRFQLQT